MAKNQSSRLKQRSVTNCSWLTSTNLMKFMEECVMYMKKYILVRKMLKNGLNIALPLDD